MTPERITAARERCEKATPGPHQTRFIYRLLKAVRDNQELLGLMVEDDASMDWKDADLWAHAQEDITVALDAIAEKDVAITELKRQLAVAEYERDLCVDDIAKKDARIAELERDNIRLNARITQAENQAQLFYGREFDAVMESQRLSAALKVAREAIETLLASAYPHTTEHPTMTAAWKVGRRAIAAIDAAA